LFFNRNRKIIEAIFTKANKAAKVSRQMILEDGSAFEMWLNSHNNLDDWEMHATVAGVFLSLQEKEKNCSEKQFRKLVTLVGERFRGWNPESEQSFYDIADFVVNSHSSGVDCISAAGLWLIFKTKNGDVGPDDVAIGYTLGQFFNRIVAQ